MATYDTIVLTDTQLDLAKSSRRCLTVDSSGNRKYVFSQASEDLYRSLFKDVVRKLEKLQKLSPNFKEVIKFTTFLDKNQPLSVNEGHTTVAIQLTDGESNIVVEVRDPAADDNTVFNWEPKFACFLPKGCTLTAPKDTIIDMWLFFTRSD
ncbi:hypothetical protein HC256_000280 [Beauveria bassiana]|nr:hypothetical protein HC256_000280 [Beauveria bassiana]